MLSSASPNTPRNNWATSSLSTCPRLARRSTGDEICVIESVKAASDIRAPLDGEIVEVNQEIADNPSLVNEDPTGKAWFFKMKLSDPSKLDGLMDEAGYKALIG